LPVVAATGDKSDEEKESLPMINRDLITTLRGNVVIDEDGDKIGNLEEIYLDQDTDQPEWALVSASALGGSKFVPLKNANTEGDNLRVAYDEDKVKGAPKMSADGELSQQEEAELYSYYGLDYSEYGSNSGLPEGEAGTAGASGDAMTRSEEEVSVGKSTQERGRARLRKYVTTENVQTTVPVQREEVRLEREPITDANRGEAVSGRDITEDEHEVTLKEEVPTVEKQVVPKERVRLSKDTITDEQEVSEEVRKEQIEQEGDVRTR
jgi:uncharacterized protein (TIGR02271 family)